MTLKILLAAKGHVSMSLWTEAVSIGYSGDARCEDAELLKMNTGYNNFQACRKRRKLTKLTNATNIARYLESATDDEENFRSSDSDCLSTKRRCT